jgi:hypothetical protein
MRTIPSTVDPSWYESYWYGVRRRHIRRHSQMIDPALLVAGLVFAALAVGVALLVLFGPALPPEAVYVAP